MLKSTKIPHGIITAVGIAFTILLWTLRPPFTHSGALYLKLPAASVNPRTTAPLKRLILHLGPHKTASTHVQTLICLNSEHLERAGVTVARPRKESHCVKGMAGWAFALQGKQGQAERYSGTKEPLKELEERIKGVEAGGTVLLSSEEFGNVPISGIRELRSIIERSAVGEVKLVVHHRRRVPHFVSWFTFDMGMGYTRVPVGLEEFAGKDWGFKKGTFGVNGVGGDNKEGYKGSEYGIRFLEFVDAWTKEFGERAKMVITSLEGSASAGRDPFEILAEEVIGIARPAQGWVPIPVRGGNNASRQEPVNASPLGSATWARVAKLVRWMEDKEASGYGTNVSLAFFTKNRKKCSIAVGAKALEGKLPIKCGILREAGRDADAVEQAYFNAHLSLLDLKYFERDADNNGQIKLPAEPTDNAEDCDVDHEQVSNKWTKEQLDRVMRSAAKKIFRECQRPAQFNKYNFP